MRHARSLLVLASAWLHAADSPAHPNSDQLGSVDPDGGTTPICTSGQDTRKPKIEDSELFKDIKVRAVKVEEAAKCVRPYIRLSTESRKKHKMTRIALTIIAALFATNAFAIEIPKRAQKRILAAAPELDLNHDGQITANELIAGSNKLPEEVRALLKPYLPTEGETTKESEPGKHKTTLPKPPAGNGATPFLDPIFEYKRIENITYGTAKSGDATMPLLLDVYQPVATDKLPKKLPVMILAFGGGWVKGSKNVKYIRDLCGFYAERGYVAISIQYRIAKDNPPAVPGPAPAPEAIDLFRLMNTAFQDTCDAVRWVRKNADKYDIDPNRIGLGGVSAGAFNALSVGFCDEKVTGPDAKVAAVISLMGAIDANHIDAGDPPVFIAHGTSDILAPYIMVRGMVHQLDKVKASYSFYPVEGVAHRLQTILDTKFDGKTVKDHSLDFCFEVMKLGELIKESR